MTATAPSLQSAGIPLDQRREKTEELPSLVPSGFSSRGLHPGCRPEDACLQTMPCLSPALSRTATPLCWVTTALSPPPSSAGRRAQHSVRNRLTANPKTWLQRLEGLPRPLRVFRCW